MKEFGKWYKKLDTKGELEAIQSCQELAAVSWRGALEMVLLECTLSRLGYETIKKELKGD